MAAQTQTEAPTSSIDPEEVAQFSRIAEEWWDPKGKFKPLHEINPLRISYIKSQCEDHFRSENQSLIPLGGLTLLDIGCGGGLICEPMARLGAEVTGIDASEKNIQTAALHADQSALTIAYQSCTAEHLVANGKQYDIVLALEIVEHVTDAQAFINACAALVKPGGLLVMSTINRTAKSLLMAKIGAEYVLRLLPRGTHDWRKFVRPDEMSRAMLASGLQIHDQRGIVLNPLLCQWKLTERDLDVNYLMTASKPALRT